MSEASQRAWGFYLSDMIGFAERVLAYTVGHDQASFIAADSHVPSSTALHSARPGMSCCAPATPCSPGARR